VPPHAQWGGNPAEELPHSVLLFRARRVNTDHVAAALVGGK
jgi:hypothetical protein